MLYTLGIDVGKEHHHATCLDERGTRCFAMDVPASAAGMASLTDRIAVTCGSSDMLLIGMEATGHYYENLFAYLSEHYEDEDAALALLNPLTTAAYAKSELTQAKTDAVDSRLIALYLLRHQPVASPPTERIRIELRRLTRARQSLVEERVVLVNRLHAAVDLAFPELPTILGSLSTHSASALLAAYPTADGIARAPVQRIRTRLHGPLGPKTAARLKAAAKGSIGVARASHATALEIQHTAARVLLLLDQIAELDASIQEQLRHFQTHHLETIPGIGIQTLAVLIAELGDNFTQRFTGPEALVAFCGLAPRVRHSGHRTPLSAPISKRGSNRARRALGLAAVIAARWNPVLREFYQRKLAQGKPKRVAHSAVARKLIHLIWGVARSGIAFDPLFTKPAVDPC